MIGIINSLSGLLFTTIICFFAFALQGFREGAIVLGVLSILGLGLRALMINMSVKNTPWYNPSRSQIRKNKIRAARN